MLAPLAGWRAARALNRPLFALPARKRSSTRSARDAALRARLEPAHRAAQKIAHYEIHDGEAAVECYRALLARVDDVGRLEYVGHADDAGDRRILKRDDGLRQERRRHAEDRLRQDDEPRRLAGGEAGGKPGSSLAQRNRLEASPHDLGEIGDLERGECYQCCDIRSE